MSPDERANAYDATCAHCGGPVPAGAGLLRHGHRGWDVYHCEHAPAPGPPPPGDHPGWHRRRLLSLDIGSTGNDPARDRITAVAVRGSDGTAREWVLDLGSNILDPEVGSDILDPEVGSDIRDPKIGSDIPDPNIGSNVQDPDLGSAPQDPDAGSKIQHASPAPPAQALEELATLLTDHLAHHELLVVWYAPHVLATLHAELLRHGLAPLAARLPDGVVAPVCDPLVLDRHADRYRPGGRSLPAVAEWYGVPLDRPGDPASDAGAALLVAGAIAASYPAVARLSRPMLHAEQVIWYAEQMERHPDAPAWPFDPVEPVTD
ncbi:hypothetical protein [Streptomyces sp. NPDC085479]|uniref:hypothetical protein n=1 Tax=Streptomyces sp. NPDC085479 TaxID=3365726 RepID=UPI0037D95848